MSSVSYQVFTDRKDAVLPTVTLKDCDGNNVTFKGYTLATAPNPITLTYVPYEERYEEYDPTKGRSFKQLRKNGNILISPLMRSHTRTFNYLVQMHREFRGRSRPSSWSNGICCATFDRDKYCTRSWTEQGDFHYWSTTYNTPIIERTKVDQSDIERAVRTTQNAAYSEALSGYDLLTELAESKETLKYLLGKVGGAASLLKLFVAEEPSTFKKARGLNAKMLLKSSDRALRKLGSRWMEFRYAIMPLIYSIRDVSELLDSSGNRYKSTRKREILLPSDGNSSLPSYCFVKETTGRVEVRSFIKQRFDSVGLQNLFESRISFNPFKTAWELIPLSFVIDWFINVGDVVTSQTSIDFSSQMVCCTSIRTKLIETTYLQDKTYDWSDLPAYANPCVTLAAEQYRYQRDIYYPLRIVATDSYNRFIFQRPPLSIDLDVFLNWKRFVDGLVLAYQPTSKTLRSLK